MIKRLLCTALLLLAAQASPAQTDTAKLNLQQFYSRCLDGDVKTALKLLEIDSNQILSTKEQQLKAQFERRFRFATDQSDYLDTHASAITPLLTIYRDYWRASLLEHSNKYDTSFGLHVGTFLANKYPAARESIGNEDSIDVYLKKYVESCGLHTTGFGKTGQFLDLLVWRSQKDTTYTFALLGEQTAAPVVFMDSFVTLGWEEYATLGRAYPGGWATHDALYCVRSAYNLTSEAFLVSYLAHESRHFADYKLFPKLQSADLEYRAKLTELSMADTILFNTIDFFIQNGNYDSENGHSIANFCVIRDLSKMLFQVEFERDLEKWKALPIAKIHASAAAALQANTRELEMKGRDVAHYIK